MYNETVLKEKLLAIENKLKIILEKRNNLMAKLKSIPQFRETGDVFPDCLEKFMLLKKEINELDDSYLSLLNQKELIIKKINKK